jgi:hypothetical protein
MGKNSGSGVRIRDEHPGSYFQELKILKFVDRSGMGEKSGSGYGMNNPDHIPRA